MPIRLTDILLPLDHSEADLRNAVLSAIGATPGSALANELQFTVWRRGVDARKKTAIQFIYTIDVLAPVLTSQHGSQFKPTPDWAYQFVTRAPDTAFTRPVIVGAGPCGLFAALVLAQMGFKPILLERGKIVRERTKDTWGFWRKSQLNTASNVQFGEGGAGTFSDGKLWTQVKDPKFYGRKVLDEMVRGGAPEEILYVSKPHIGTFRLVKVVEYLRQQIESLGGEIRFSHQLADLHFEPTNSSSTPIKQLKQLRAISVDGPQGRYQLPVSRLVLALGHSARDTFEMLHQREVFLRAKPFSVGFRIEHPQGLIDKARHGPFAGNKMLGAADYKLVHHASNGRSVYSFCMCPGGTVVAATSETGRVVTNGMSQYSRNERNANAGIVVGIEPADYDFGPDGEPLVAESERGHPLAGVRFQRALESRAFELGGANYFAPVQRVQDFLASRASTQLGSVEPSYKPGVTCTDLSNPTRPALPMYAIQAVQLALPQFARQIPGFDLADAVLTGVETRTSSPVRIEREPKGERALQSVNVNGLYPAGEGAGYAGGIMSAAMDGIQVAERIALAIVEQAMVEQSHKGSHGN